MDSLYPADIEGHRNAIEPGCDRCPQLKETRTQISWGYGPRPSKIMFVAEAPARGKPSDIPWQGSNVTGIPMTNRKSGLKVRRFLREAGIDMNDHYVTNVVKCFPPDDEDGKKARTPTKGEQRRCWTHMEHELKKVRPNLVVCIGGVSWNAFHKMSGLGTAAPVLEAVRSSPVKARDFDIAVMIHPARFESWLSKVPMTVEEYAQHIGELVRTHQGSTVAAVNAPSAKHRKSRSDGRQKMNQTAHIPNSVTTTERGDAASTGEATSSRRLWVVRAGKKSEAHNIFMERSVVAIRFWQQLDIGDASKLLAFKEAFRQACQKAAPDEAKGHNQMRGDQLYKFVHEMRVGDGIVYPSKEEGRVRLGVVQSEYFWREVNPRFNHQREVRWLDAVSRTSVSESTDKALNHFRTIYELPDYCTEFDSLFNQYLFPDAQPQGVS
jgi:uracil-DNA glycosylase